MNNKLHVPANVLANFDAWQRPKRGIANPENQTNAVWSWLVRTGACPVTSHDTAGSGEKKSPGWCFRRMGQSKTRHPDGRLIYIGGEHEDSYDPDFFIYNDVVVRNPNGSIEIYGYPAGVFPPTDFHSATLCQDEIFIIGRLGYRENRDPGATPVYRLQLSDYSIHPLICTGDAPPALHKHLARLDTERKKIICSGGIVFDEKTEQYVENIGTWELDLDTFCWSFVESKPYSRWLLTREDNSYNELWNIEQIVCAVRSGQKDKFAEGYRKKFAERGHEIDADLFEARFSPPFPHQSIKPVDPLGEDYRVHRFKIKGVVVRVVEDMTDITVTVEGELPADLLALLERFGLETYSAIEGVPYKSIHL